MKKNYEPPKTPFDYKMQYGYIIIDGKYYKPSLCDGKPILWPISKKTFDKQLKMAKKLAKILKDDLDSELVLIEKIMKMTPDAQVTISELLLDKDFKPKKEKPKVKTRAHRCVDMKIGDDFWFQIC